MFNKLIAHKKGLFLALCLGVLFGFTGCDKDEPGSTTPNRTSDGNLVVSFGGTTLFNGQDLNLGTTLVGVPIELIFDVENIGKDPITLTGRPTIDLVNEGSLYQGYSISKGLPEVIPPGGKIQFIIIYKPTMAGDSNCTINIYTNESAAILLHFGLHAVARLHAPEIQIFLTNQEVNGTTDTSRKQIINEESFHLSSFEIGGYVDMTFNIYNNGTSNLTPGDDQGVVNLSDSESFTLITDAGTDPIGPGNYSEFVIRYQPTTIGNHVTHVTIESDDPETSPFSFYISGSSYQGEVVLLPEIAVLVDNANAEQNSEMLIGSQLVNTSRKVKLTIKNIGTADLTLGNSTTKAISISNDSTCFSIDNQPKQNYITPENSLTASLIFAPLEEGRCCTNVTITNNDADEGNLTFTLCGEGTLPSTAAAITDYMVELHQNVGKDSHKVITYKFTNDLTMGTYVVFARNAADLPTWANLFDPILTSEQLEKVSFYWNIRDEETGATWESNGNDDVVIIKNPKGDIVDKVAVSENAHKVRTGCHASQETQDAATEFDGNEGVYQLGLTAAAATGALDKLTGCESSNYYTDPIYIYEVGERGKNNSLGGTTQLADMKGNYVIFYLPSR